MREEGARGLAEIRQSMVDLLIVLLVAIGLLSDELQHMLNGPA